jgi:hypothetical protein
MVGSEAATVRIAALIACLALGGCYNHNCIGTAPMWFYCK